MSRAPVDEAHGTAPNVALGDDSEPTPFEVDRNSHRVIVAHCCSCPAHETILAEPGRTREWEHARRNPRHIVDYHREDKE